MNKKTALSIIIPVYNSADVLHRCVDSILDQEYTSFELLLINDGSIDNSLEICNQYARIDSRIRVFDQPNLGVSSARNKGLANSVGEWIMFIDSDDWIYPNTLCRLIDESQFVDMVLGAMYFENGGCVMSLCENNRIFAGRDLELIIQDNINHCSFNSPCAKLFRRQIIIDRNLSFDEALCFGEDSLFVKKYLLNVKDIRVVHSLCYHYCDSGDGIYKKYSKNFKPIYLYYVKMVSMYAKMSTHFNISINNKDLIGVIFNIALNCILRNGVKDYCYVRRFLVDHPVRIVLRSRCSKYLNALLYLAKYPYGFPLVVFVKFVENLKGVLSRIFMCYNKS